MIDFSQAPEGATHYDTDDKACPWLKVECAKWCYYYEGIWVEYEMDDEVFSHAVPMKVAQSLYNEKEDGASNANDEKESILPLVRIGDQLQVRVSNHIRCRYQGDKPTKGSDGAAGYDVRACEEVTIQPNTSGAVHTSTKLQPQIGHAYLAMPRSSICNKDLMLKNSVGLIDNDYTGSTVWKFYNYGSEPVTIKKGERIGQFVFFKTIDANFVNAEFDQTDRG